MGVLGTMNELLIVFMLGYVFMVSGLIVNFLMLCTVVVWPFHRSLYRQIISRLTYLHWSHISAVTQWWSGSDCELYMDPEDHKYVGTEHKVMIINHIYEVDWVMVWLLGQRNGILANCKIYAKHILKYVPVLGWAWYFSETIFLKRDWETDKQILDKGLDSLMSYPDNLWVTIILFPEGTRLTPEKLKTSNEVARQKGYPELKYHLLPRTKGFYQTMKKVRSKFAVYDCTCAYPEGKPEPRLWDIIVGKPCTFKMRVRRIPSSDIPEEEEACSAWLRALFKEKDDIMHTYMVTGKFDRPRLKQTRGPEDLLITLFWFIVIYYFLISSFLAGTWVQQLICVVVIFVVLLLITLLMRFGQVEKGSSYGKSVIPEDEKQMKKD